MKNSKLVRILASLEKAKIKPLQKFLESSYFNTDPNVIALISLLLKHYPDFPEDRIRKKKLFIRLFGKGTGYDDLRMRRLSSKTFKLVEHFLALEDLFGHPFKRKHSILKYYADKELLDLYRLTFPGLAELLSETPSSDPDFLHYAFLFTEEQRINNAITTGLTRSTRQNEHLQTMLNALDRDLLLRKLRLACSVLNHSRIVPFDYHILMLDEMLEAIAGNEHLQLPILRAYRSAILTMKVPDEEMYFKDFKHELTNHGASFPRYDVYLLYTRAKNYCIEKLHEGKDEYTPEFFDIFKSELEQYIIPYDEEITISSFKNAVGKGLRLGEYEWVWDFIHTHKDKILSTHREDAVRFCEAYYYFYKREYDKSMELLFKSEFKDVFFKLASRRMLLQIYFEQEELDARDNLANSLRVFVQNKKAAISEAYIRKMRNYLNAFQALCRIIPGDKSKAHELEKKILAEPLIQEKDWLIEKCREIQK